MDSLLVKLLIICSLFLLVACGPRLSDQEGIDVISAGLGYPKTISKSITFWDHDDTSVTSSEMLASLLAKGDIVFSRSTYSQDYYIPRKKGATYIKSEVRKIGKNLQFECAYGQEFLLGIQKVLINKKTMIASVNFATSSRPFEPYFSTVFAKSHEFRENELKFGEIKTQTVQLYRKGKIWRIHP
ncbi:hypothetical protein ACFL6N_00470 [Thermodesulfobacteriota bacterium]